jgi:hypothetical protein
VTIAAYFCHRSTGKLKCANGWCRLYCDEEIIRYHERLLLWYGVKLSHRGSREGAHVTVARPGEPHSRYHWGLCDGAEVEFWYSHEARHTDYHVWLDVFSPTLSDIRKRLGLMPRIGRPLSDGTTKWHSFHLTIGRY